MDLFLASISTTRSRPKSHAAAELADDFLKRASVYASCQAIVHPSEEALFAWVDRQGGRTSAHLILLDSRGTQMSSEEFAVRLGDLRDRGAQTIVISIGPASGWSPAALSKAGTRLSLGRMTLPHELARAVVAEQIYRAFTILARHPYHSGH